MSVAFKPLDCCWITREFGKRDISLLREKYFQMLIWNVCGCISNIGGSSIYPSLLCFVHSCVSALISTLDLRDQGITVNFGPEPYFGVFFGHFSRRRVFWFSQWLIGLSVYGNTIKRATGHRAVPKWVPAGLLMLLCYCRGLLKRHLLFASLLTAINHFSVN